jgi:hypothetical protein
LNDKRGQFTFYRSFWDAISGLPKKDKLPILEAVITYALDGEEPKGLSSTQNACFLLVKPNLDSARKKAASGKQGGSKGKATGKQNESKPKQTASEKEEEIEKENENETEVEGEKEKKHAPPIDGTLFTRFWEAYPNKLGREKAWEAWKKLNPDHTMAEILVSALECWKRSERWRNKAGDLQFAPRAEAFLSDEGYWKHPPGVEGISKGASGLLGAAELEAIQRVLQSGPRRQLDEDEQAAIERMMRDEESL